MTTPDTTICIPAYDSADTVGEAIASVLAQSHKDIHVIVSVDPGPDRGRTEDVCRAFASDPRLELSINPERLGWVGNVNACLDRVATGFFGFCFHDDRLHPDFVADLRRALKRTPAAVAASGRIESFGTRDKPSLQPALEGGAFARAAARLTGTFGNSYSLKCLLRSDPVRAGLRLPELPLQGYYADWPFALAYALEGGFVGLPQTLYFKRFWDGSVTAGWDRAPLADVIEAEIAFRAELIEVIQTRGDITPEERETLTAIALDRLPNRPLDTAREFGALHEALCAGVAARLLTRARHGTPTASDRGRRNALAAAHATAVMHTARSAKRSGDSAAALAGARRALRLDPDCAGAHLLAGTVLLELAADAARGDPPEALRHLRAAAEQDPANIRARVLLVHALLRSGDRDAARRAYDEVCAAAPPDTQGLAALRRQFEPG